MPGSSLEDRIGAMVAAFPDLVEIYPLERFLEALLSTAQKLTGSEAAGCHVVKCRRLSVQRDGELRIDPVSEEPAAAVAEAGATGALLSPRALGGGAAARALGDLRQLHVVPCPILSRPVGHLLLPRKGPHGRQLALLAQLAGYYLHRNEIEREIARLGGPFAIMGCSPWIFEVQEDLERFARLRDPVVITGESGSGKEIIAQAVHALSPRRDAAFVSVNCAAAPSENLLLAEFFGHRRGAFTGAVFDKEGCCQQAHGGTLFLDEIGEMSHELQTLLLRTIITGEVRRLGDERVSRVDIRLISASNRDLYKATQERSFRTDLYYRISTFRLHIPPLRERIADLRYLAEFTLHCFAHANELPAKQLTEAALRKLERHPWPGNVRELENVLKRAFVLAPGEAIDADHVRLESGEWAPPEPVDRLLLAIRSGGSFWDVIYRPFIRRDLTRAEVGLVIDEGLRRAGGQLKRLASQLNVAPEEYPRFVSFLHRHGFRARETGEGPEAI